MKIGYARVSTDDQNLELQLDALKAAGCERIETDKISGVATERPGLDKLINDILRPGDVLVVWRLDRLARSLKMLLELVEKLHDRQINLASLHESIDTSSSTGRLIFQIFGAISEFERNLIKERTYSGLAAARARGRRGGRPAALDEKRATLACRLYEEKKHTITEICEMVGVSKPTLYRYLRGKSSGRISDAS